MGLYASAKLVWGIPVEAYSYDKETYEQSTHPLWVVDEEEDYEWSDYGEWRDDLGDLEVVSYGHYEDPDNHRGILTIKNMPRFRGDCWDPEAVVIPTLINPDILDSVNAAARAAGFETDFYNAKWWLVASYG
jgi:hypothetical protein